jgi:hypothetical protein
LFRIAPQLVDVALGKLDALEDYDITLTTPR